MTVVSNQIESGQPGRFQLGCEKTLLWTAAVLAVYHMLLNTFRYVVADHELLEIYDRRFGLLLLVAVVVYLLSIRFFNPASWHRVRSLAGKMHGYEYYFLFFLAFWYAFSCFMRQKFFGRPAFKENDWWLYITFLTSFLYFPITAVVGAVRAKKLIEPMLKIVLIPHMIFFAWVIWQYYHMNRIMFPSGNWLEMVYGNSLAVGENRNITGLCSLTFMFLCWYFVVTQKSFRKAIYGVGILIYFVTLVLSNCRTAWYASLIMFAMIAFLLPWKSMAGKSSVLRAGVGLATVLLCVLFVHWARGEIFFLLDRAIHSPAPVAVSSWSGPESYKPVLLGHFVQLSSDAASAEHAMVSSARSYEIGLNGRIPIYQASLNVMLERKYNFLFGVTPADVGRETRNRFGINISVPHAHNFFLQMGVSYGAPVMLASVFFVALLVVKSFRIMFHKESVFPGDWMVPVYVLTQLVAEIPETWITSSSAIICPVFYLFAGWVTAISDKFSPETKRRDTICAGISSVELVALIAMMCWLIPWVDTLRSDLNVDSLLELPALYLLALAAGICFLILLFWELERILEAKLLRQRPKKRQVILLGVSLLIVVSGMLLANHQINKICEKESEILEQERPAIEAVLNNTGCQLFVDTIPEVYCRAFSSAAYIPYHGNELYTFQNTALLTNAETEYDKLIARGFLYVTISEEHAIYTNSAAAIEALQAEGYHLTGYYSRIHAVDLDSASLASYGKPTVEEDKIILSDFGPLKTGEKIIVFSAPYKVTYALNLDRKLQLDPETVVATLAVISKNGGIITSRDVLFSEFEKDGIYNAELDFAPPGVDEVQFLIEPKENTNPLILESISYRRNPTYDTHAEFDTQGRRIRELYYDLNGKPLIGSDGSMGKAFAYDSRGNIVEVRYLDSEGNLCLNYSGYAIIRREYNEKKQIICEEYFDTEESPVNIGIGYHMVENEYDNADNLSLTYFYDLNGKRILCGSSNFHDYLTELAKKEKVTILIAVRDEATESLTSTLLKDLKQMGIQTDLKGKYRFSYYAVITPDGVFEELSSDQPVSFIGNIDGVECSIVSAGLNAGDSSSIIINGTEYSKNNRGMNIVVVEDGLVTDAVCFDTYSVVMAMTR